MADGVVAGRGCKPGFAAGVEKLFSILPKPDGDGPGSPPAAAKGLEPGDRASSICRNSFMCACCKRTWLGELAGGLNRSGKREAVAGVARFGSVEFFKEELAWAGLFRFSEPGAKSGFESLRKSSSARARLVAALRSFCNCFK